MPRPLDPDEERVAALLARAGVGAAASRVFAALARGGGHTATDLAAVTALSRQDAGEGANELTRRQLARVERVPTGGRPTNRYHAASAGVRALVDARRAAIQEELDTLDELEKRYG